MTETDIRDILRLYKEHGTFSAVARVLGISKTTAAKFVRLDQRSIFTKLWVAVKQKLSAMWRAYHESK